MYSDSETDPDVIRAVHSDPTNVILVVERQADLGLATAGINPTLSAGAQNGWVSTNTSETLVAPGAFSTDEQFTQGTSTGTIGGGGEDPTGAGDGTPVGPGGGYRKKEDPVDDPNENDFLLN